MKKTTILLAAMAMVFAGSCQRIEETFIQNSPVSGEEMTFEATLAEADLFDVSETKTALQSDGKSIYWTPNDQISIFYGANNAGMFWTEITQPAKTASFTGRIGVATGSAEDDFVAPSFWGVYPYDRANSCDGSSVSLNILGEQVASPGTFGNGMNPSIANSPGLGLSFYNVGSWLRFSVTSEGITSATFSGNAGEILAGRVTVKMDSNKKPLITGVENGLTSITVTPEGGGSFVPGQLYYITLIPQTIGGTGYTLALFKDNKVATCVVADPAKTYAFNRSEYRSKKNADEGLTWRDVLDGYLCFTAVEDGTIALSNSDGNAPDVKYSTDCITWTPWDYSAISVPAGGKVYFKGDNSNGFSSSSYSKFVMTGKFAASGSVQSLLYDDYFENNLTIPSEGCFSRLFEACPITTAPKLPATTLAGTCYSRMFYRCVYLTAAPELPAETLARYCYMQMFLDCPSLSVAPELPATIMANGCYNDMFRQCTSLVTAPELPGTTLAYACYRSMFAECTSLVSAPDLPAATLARECYASMFKNCSNLSYIKIMATAVSGSDCLSEWVSGVASSGTFVKNKAFSMETGVSGIPEGWVAQEYVEMGNGLMLADRNIGADVSLGYGSHFAWGETETKTDYSWSTYFDNPSGDGVTFNKYGIGKKTVLDPENDAATVKWCSAWRTPTASEWESLCKTSDYEWVWDDNIGGFVVTSKVAGYEGNNIFLPAGGERRSTDHYNLWESGLYMSSTLKIDSNSTVAKNASCLFFSADESTGDMVTMTDTYRCAGFSVRPILK